MNVLAEIDLTDAKPYGGRRGPATLTRYEEDGRQRTFVRDPLWQPGWERQRQLDDEED